jgi:hypothetical protein
MTGSKQRGDDNIIEYAQFKKQGGSESLANFLK